MIWVKKTENENGSYVDAEGKRYITDWCIKMYTPDGTTEADHGYERHESVEAACTAWNLTPYVDPEAEGMLLEATPTEQ